MAKHNLTIPKQCPLPVPGHLLVEMIAPDLNPGGDIIIPDNAKAREAMHYKFVLLAGTFPGYDLAPGTEIYARQALPINMPTVLTDAVLQARSAERRFMFVPVGEVYGYYAPDVE